MHTATDILKSFHAEQAMDSGFAGMLPPINLIILEKSSAYRTALKIQQKALKTAFFEDPLKRETISMMIDDGLH